MNTQKAHLGLFTHRANVFVTPTLFELPPAGTHSSSFINVPDFVAARVLSNGQEWTNSATNAVVPFVLNNAKHHKDIAAIPVNQAIKASVPYPCTHCDNCKLHVRIQTVASKFFFFFFFSDIFSFFFYFFYFFVTALKPLIDEALRLHHEPKQDELVFDYEAYMVELIAAEDHMVDLLRDVMLDSLDSPSARVQEQPDEHKLHLQSERNKLEVRHKKTSALLRSAQKEYKTAEDARNAAHDAASAAKIESESANAAVARASATKKAGALSKKAAKLQQKTDSMLVKYNAACAAFEDAKQALDTATKEDAAAKHDFDLAEMDIESYATTSARSQESEGESSLSLSGGSSSRRMSNESCEFADACARYKKAADSAYSAVCKFVETEVVEKSAAAVNKGCVELNVALLSIHHLCLERDEKDSKDKGVDTCAETDILVVPGKLKELINLAYVRADYIAGLYQDGVERQARADLMINAIAMIKHRANLFFSVGEEYRKSGCLANLDSLDECPLFSKKCAIWKKSDTSLVSNGALASSSFNEWIKLSPFKEVHTRVLSGLEDILASVAKIEFLSN
jgi:hypothetical protein